MSTLLVSVVKDAARDRSILAVEYLEKIQKQLQDDKKRRD